MEISPSLAPRAEVDTVPRPGFLLRQVHLLYKNRFRTWFAITAPTSLLAAIVLLLADQQIKAIFKSIPRDQLQFHYVDMAGAGMLRFGSFFLSWLFGCFALAAIATAVNDLDDGGDSPAWKHDAYQRAREHLGVLVLLALITFCTFLVGMIGWEFVEFAAARAIGSPGFSRFVDGATLFAYVVTAGMVSWLGTAIPLIMREDMRLRAALKRSVELSNGYEGALFVLVVESVAGSFLAWYTASYGMRFLVPYALRNTSWYGWIVSLAAVLATAAVDSPLFIGFSLLADPERLRVQHPAELGIQ